MQRTVPLSLSHCFRIISCGCFFVLLVRARIQHDHPEDFRIMTDFLIKFSRELQAILSCEDLGQILTKWFVRYGTDEDDFVSHTVKDMDEKMEDDTSSYDLARKAGKRAR